MDYEYDDEPLEGRILWGRIAVYGVAFVLVFLLGSCFGSRGAPSEEELQQLNDRVRDLASENEVLEQQLEAAGGGTDSSVAGTDSSGDADGGAAGDGDGTLDGGEEDGDSPDEGDGGEAEAGDADGGSEPQVYVVEPGDNLYRIAQEHYGDGSQWRKIAEENGLDASNPLTVGQELRIPPAD